MDIAYRTSPLHGVIETLNPVWAEINRMKVPLRFAGDEDSARQRLGLSDLSFLPRFGLKGPGAAEWLLSHGVTSPAGINHWGELDHGGIIARLGTNEFFLEDGLNGNTVAPLRAALNRGLPGVVPVFRQDAALAITGNEVNSLLVQTCNVNFNGFGMNERLVVMTSMVGVSVLVIRSLREGVPFYRIWCDGTFGPYLWTTLLQISGELGGAAIGVGGLFPETVRLGAFSKSL